MQVNGGGLNSSLSSGTVTLQTPLPDGESIDVRFLLGIQQTGSFKFFINIEALTREPVIPPDTELSKPSTGTPLGPSVRPRKGVTALPSAPSPNVSAPSARTGKSASPTVRGRGKHDNF